MQNKGYSHPYGNTLFPNPPPIVIPASNGSSNGPAGAPSAIPGTIGVAGVYVHDEVMSHEVTAARGHRGHLDGHFKLAGSNQCLCGQGWPHGETSPAYMAPEQPRIPTIAEAMGQGAIDAMLKAGGYGVLDGLVNMLVERLAPRVAELVAQRVMGVLGDIGAQAFEAASVAAVQATPISRGVVFTGGEPGPSMPTFAGMPSMVAGAASPNAVQGVVNAGIGATAMHAIGISSEQINAYTRVHIQLVATVTDVFMSARVLRDAPEPPVFELKARNGTVSEWTAYSALYDQPRFRLSPSASPFASDRFLLMRIAGGASVNFGYVTADQIIDVMMTWFEDNQELAESQP